MKSVNCSAAVPARAQREAFPENVLRPLLRCPPKKVQRMRPLSSCVGESASGRMQTYAHAPGCRPGPASSGAIGVILEVLFLCPPMKLSGRPWPKFGIWLMICGRSLQAGFELVFFLHFGDGPSKGIPLGKDESSMAPAARWPRRGAGHEFRIGRQGKEPGRLYHG